MPTRTLPIQTLLAAMPPARQNSFDPIFCFQVFFLQCCQEASMASSQRILVCLCLQSYRSSFCWLESSWSPSLDPTLYLWWSLSFHIFTADWNTENCASARPPRELLPTCRIGKRTNQSGCLTVVSRSLSFSWTVLEASLRPWPKCQQTLQISFI